jgi:metalloprotein, YbeY family
MPNHLFISYQDDSTILSSFIDEGVAVDFVSDVLKYLKKENWDVSLHFCFDPFIKELNKTYRNIDSPTDVLSFEMGNEYVDESGVPRYVAGDIVISIDSLKKNAINFFVSENEELKRLIIHSILHLSGMDHSDNSKDQPMLVLQEDILKLFNDIKIIREEK